MIGKATSRALKGTCGLSRIYRVVLICAACFCAFAFIVMFEYTYEYNRTNLTLNISTQSSLETMNHAEIVRKVSQTNKTSIVPGSTAVSSKVVAMSKAIVPLEAVVQQKVSLQHKGTIRPDGKTTLGLKPVKAAVQTTSKTMYALTLERNYILENPYLCSSVDNLSILIIIHTAPGNFLRRQNIRSTYANATYFQSLGTLRVLFLLGRVKNASVQDKLEAEFKQNMDILQGDFIDAYRNLTHKGVMAYKWIQERCRNAKVILKADDDIIVNTYKLFTEILPNFQKKSKTILCNHILPGTMLIIRDKKSKWYVNENEFRGQKFYPRYCSGFFVMITNDIIPAIYKSAFITPFFWVDDVFLYGLLPSKVLGVNYSGLKKGSFNLGPLGSLKCYRNATRVCDYLITGASKPEHVAEIWRHMAVQYQRKLAEKNVAITTAVANEGHVVTTVAAEPGPLQQRLKNKIFNRLLEVQNVK